MNFGEAIELLKSGARVTRGGWNGKRMWLGLCRPGPHGMTRPFLFIHDAQGERVPWAPSQTDVLADDWTQAAP